MYIYLGQPNYTTPVVCNTIMSTTSIANKDKHGALQAPLQGPSF